MASRRPSPRRLTAKTTIRTATLGTMASQGESRIFSKPSLIKPPQVGVGGFRPRPMKASEASVRMALASQSVPITRISGKIFGKIWPQRIRVSEKPSVRHASMKSRPFLVARVEDEVGKGLFEGAAGKGLEAFVQTLVDRGNGGGREGISASSISCITARTSSRSPSGL